MSSNTPLDSSPIPKPEHKREQELAWIGDAVLALFAREHVLQRLGKIDTEAFLSLTRNHFLAAIGRPTRIEAEIGLIYDTSGLKAAFEYIESRLIPTWNLQEAKRLRQRKTSLSKKLSR